MRRAEAEQLLGQEVEAWTAANGVYVGTLAELTDDRPWRGVVSVSGVIAPALAFDVKRPQSARRGFRPGERLEVGAASIRPARGPGRSYREALAVDLVRLEELLAKDQGRDRWWLERAIAVRKRQLAEE